jgi:O-methyltransferase
MIKTLQAVHRFLDVSRMRRYGLAILLMGLGMTISRFSLAGHPWMTCATLAAAAVASAWFGGSGPGLLSTMLLPVAAWINLAATGDSNHSVTLLFWTVVAGSVALVTARARLATLRRWREQEMQALPLWEEDAKFDRIMQTIQHTLVDRTRCYMLFQMARQTSQTAGEVAEVGVYKGGTARLLALALPEKTVHLFDTFAGMPSTNVDFDKHFAGDFHDTSLDAVQERLKDCGNVRFYKGLFPATSTPIEQVKFSLVHVDADIYDSVRACCEFFYSRLEKGAVMLFDDYGFPTCPGARKAVDEFFSDKPEIPFYLPTGQCWVMRK